MSKIFFLLIISFVCAYNLFSIRYPVLIAVDDFNSLFGNTGFMKPIHLRSEKITWVYGDEISVLRALNRPQHLAMINGTMVCSLTTKSSKKDFSKTIDKQLFEDGKVEIPPYTRDEYRARVLQYKNSGDIINVPSTMTEQYIYQLCGGVPKLVATYYSTVI